jgi:RNA ligase
VRCLGGVDAESVEGVYEKVDGWMGTLYRYGGQFHIATGGSLVTEGGRIATDMLRQHDLTDLPDDVTLVFEIVHPHTRVVVDYGECRELVLLAAFNRYTGDEYPWTSVEAWGRRFGFRTPTRWPWNEAMVRGALEQYAPDRWEGFVVKLLDGRRAKLRSAAYVAALRASEPARRGRIL